MRFAPSKRTVAEEGRDCSELLIQLAAIRGEITNISKVILKDHLDHCIVDAVRENDESTLSSLKEAIDKWI